MTQYLSLDHIYTTHKDTLIRFGASRPGIKSYPGEALGLFLDTCKDLMGRDGTPEQTPKAEKFPVTLSYFKQKMTYLLIEWFREMEYILTSTEAYSQARDMSRSPQRFPGCEDDWFDMLLWEQSQQDTHDQCDRNTRQMIRETAPEWLTILFNSDTKYFTPDRRAIVMSKVLFRKDVSQIITEYKTSKAAVYRIMNRLVEVGHCPEVQQQLRECLGMETPDNETFVSKSVVPIERGCFTATGKATFTSQVHREKLNELKFQIALYHYKKNNPLFGGILIPTSLTG